MLYNVTTRIPHLMKQSHLETSEGKYHRLTLRAKKKSADMP